MKIQSSIIFFLLLISNISNAQKDWKSELKLTVFDSVLHSRIYQIQIDDYQMVELIEYNKGEFDGSLINTVWKNEGKKYHTELIIQNIKIPSLRVKKLMNLLKDKDFETIPNCKDIKGCVEGLDGKSISFYVFDKKITRSYSYWEPESDYYYKDPIIKEVLKVRDILKTINSEFNLWDYFEKFRDRLPSGSYNYGMVGMQKISIISE